MDTNPPARGAFSVAVIDNHESMREGVEAMLRSHPDEFVVTGSYVDVESLSASPDPNPHAVVLDLRLGRDDTLSTEWVGPLVAGGSIVLMHTSEERPAHLRAAVSAGAAGVSLKNDGIGALYLALKEVCSGGFACSSVLADALVNDSRILASLTPREIEVLEGLYDGLTREQVARRLGIGSGTIKSHLESVREKYLQLDRPVTNAASLVREATRDGWID